MSSIQFVAVTTNLNAIANLPKAQWAKLSDAQLTELYKAGEDYAAALLYARHKKTVHNVVRANMKSVANGDLEADYIENEAFNSAFDAIRRGDYAESEQFKNDVTKAARNKALDYLKSAHHKNTVIKDFDNRVEETSVARNADTDLYEEDNADFVIDTEALTSAEIRELRLQLIEKCLSKLSSEQVDVLLARVPNLGQDADGVDQVLELSFKEIAEKFGISINTATSRYQYAIKALRKVIKEELRGYSEAI